MIITLTPNPSIDATLSVDQVVRGEVVRAHTASREAGGKGINVSHAVAKAGGETLALAPCGGDDPFLHAVRRAGIPFAPIEVDGFVRTNTALTEADGTTTKINELGPEMSAGRRVDVEKHLLKHAHAADAAVLAGSLPPGAPHDWYAVLCAQLRGTVPLIAVDTSDAPLRALGARLEEAAPTIMKPNAFELAQLTDGDGHALEADAAQGNYGPILQAARQLVARGVAEVLVTLGGAGACLVTAEGAWAAAAPKVTVRSTVGAGDSSLAGYVMARVDGKSFAECLQQAVAYGSAAASLPGTGIPSPADVDCARVDVVALDDPAPSPRVYVEGHTL